MQTVITGLTTALSATAMWGALADLVPLIGVVALFSLGLHFTRRVTRGAARGKVKF